MFNYDYLDELEIDGENGSSLDSGRFVLGIDFRNGGAIMANRDLRKIDEVEAILQKILKYLKTEAGSFVIYNPENNSENEIYGTTLYETIGHTFTTVVLSKYVKEITKYILAVKGVLNVESFTIQPVEDKLLLGIYIKTIYEDIEIKEVLDLNYDLYQKGV